MSRILPSFLLMTAVVMIVPGLTALSIVGERERQTFQLLQVTQLSPLQIVLGAPIFEEFLKFGLALLEAELQPGTHVVASRATDAGGTAQPEDFPPNERGYWFMVYPARGRTSTDPPTFRTGQPVANSAAASIDECAPSAQSTAHPPGDRRPRDFRGRVTSCKGSSIVRGLEHQCH